MIIKNTFSTGGVWLPDSEGNTQKKLAGPCEVVSLSLSGNGSAFLEVYDAADASGAQIANMKTFLSAGAGGDTDEKTYSHPLAFKRGVFAKLVQGAGFNPYVAIAVVGDPNV